jgi:hypothetical protein
VREVAQISKKCESRDSNSIVRDDSSDNPIFLFDVTHAAANAEESEHEGLRLPEAQKSAEKGKVKNKITNIDYV